MKKFFCSLALLCLSLLPLSAFAGHGDGTLYAVTFHADWCGSCRALEPNMIKARGKSDLDNKNVLFVKLDLTNSTTRHQAMLLAEALDLGDYYDANKGKTGYVLLVDSSKGKAIGKITKDMDAKQISKMIMDGIRRVERH